MLIFYLEGFCVRCQIPLLRPVLRIDSTSGVGVICLLYRISEDPAHHWGGSLAQQT